MLTFIIAILAVVGLLALGYLLILKTKKKPQSDLSIPGTGGQQTSDLSQSFSQPPVPPVVPIGSSAEPINPLMNDITPREIPKPLEAAPNIGMQESVQETAQTSSDSPVSNFFDADQATSDDKTPEGSEPLVSSMSSVYEPKEENDEPVKIELKDGEDLKVPEYHPDLGETSAISNETAQEEPPSTIELPDDLSPMAGSDESTKEISEIPQDSPSMSDTVITKPEDEISVEPKITIPAEPAPLSLEKEPEKEIAITTEPSAQPTVHVDENIRNAQRELISKTETKGAEEPPEQAI